MIKASLCVLAEDFCIKVAAKFCLLWNDAMVDSKVLGGGGRDFFLPVLKDWSFFWEKMINFG